MIKPLSFFNSLVLTFAVLILAFSMLSWSHAPVGDFGDWVIGLLALGWLIVITTVPWNLYFRASAVLADAGPSRERGLPVDDRQVAYVTRLKGIALFTALGLHGGSAIVLFALAFFLQSHWGGLGYVPAALALLLAGLRPAISAYEYFASRLNLIGHGWRYPREDVVELRQRLAAAEASVSGLQLHFDLQLPDSLASQHRALSENASRDVAKLQEEVDELRASNTTEHEQLARDARSGIAQLSADGQFLDHVREIIRFFKTA